MNAWSGLSRAGWLSCAEGDDAANRIVGRHTDGHAVARHDLDPEAAHPAAQLRQHFVAGIALDAIQPAGMDSDDRALHINKIIFAQQLILSLSNECATLIRSVQRQEIVMFARMAEKEEREVKGSRERKTDRIQSDRTCFSTWCANPA